MKLWTKSLISFGIIAGTAGATIGAIYGYSKSSIAQGYKHVGGKPLSTALLHAQLSDPDTILPTTLNDSVNTSKIITKYDPKTDTINGIDSFEYIKQYAKNHKGVPPVMIVQAGPVTFENYYADVITPKDFYAFVKWFFANVAWGPDVATLRKYRIARGPKIETNGNATLGGFQNDGKENKIITFYPDSFFRFVNGSYRNWTIGSPVSPNNFGQELGNLLFPLTKALTKAELTAFVGEWNKAQDEVKKKMADKDYQPMQIYSIEKDKDDKTKYVVYGSKFAKQDGKKSFLELLNNANEDAKTLLSDVTPTVDANGHLSLNWNKSLFKISASKDVTYLQALKSMPGFKGLQISFLKYVTAHEYGHEQTLNQFKDASGENLVRIGDPMGKSISQTVFQNSFADINVVNMYLAARAPELKAIRVKNTGFNEINGSSTYEVYDPNDKSQNPRDYRLLAFEYKLDAGNVRVEELKDIFGQDVSFETKGKGLDASIDQSIWSKGTFRFFLKDFDAAKALQQKLGIDLSAIFLMNAFDNFAGSISPGFEQGATEKNVFLINGKFVSAETEEYKKSLQGYKLDKNNQLVKTPFFVVDSVTNTLRPDFNLVEKNDPSIKMDRQWMIKRVNEYEGAGTIDPDTMDDKKIYEKLTEFILGTFGTYYNYVRSVSGWDAIYDTVDGRLRDGLNNTNPAELGNVFSNYVFSPAEVLTRDFVQITYVPDTEEQIDGTSFLVSTEANSGFDQIISDIAFEDFKPLYNPEVWYGYKSSTATDPKSTPEYLYEYIKALPDTDPLKDHMSQWSAYNVLVNFAKNNMDKKVDPKDYKIILQQDTAYSFQQSYLKVANFGSQELGGKVALILNKDGKYNDWYHNPWEIFNGISMQSKKTGSGFYEDLFQRSHLKNDDSDNDAWKLYDDNGQSINDTDLKITDLDGQIVTDRARAYWMYLLRSKGIGDRTLSSVHRDVDRDAVTMWGFFKKKYENKVKYLTFSKGSRKVHIPLNLHVDNLFYLQEQGNVKTKKTLEDEGYVSWMTDYKVLGLWRDAAIASGEWDVYFSDENHKQVNDDNGKNLFTLGSKTSVNENGKPDDFAPVKFYVKNGKAVALIKDEFE